MRFKNVGSFFRHLNQAFPDHLCRIYLVIAENDADRKDVLLNIRKVLSKTAVHLSSFSPESSLREILCAIQTPSIFLQEPLVTIDLIEHFSEKKKLASYFNLCSGYFLFGARKQKQLETILPAVEKYGVILDLTEEKPWDRKKRLTEFLFQAALKEKITISEEAVQELISRSDDVNVLSQELSKLICYVDGVMRIEKKDVEALCTTNAHLSSWKIAEQLVWYGQGMDKTEELDAKLFQALIHSLRYQFHFGLELSFARRQDLKKKFPHIWPKTLDFKKQKADELTQDYFKKGLEILLDIEWLSKNNMSCYDVLINLFYSKLISCRR